MTKKLTFVFAICCLLGLRPAPVLAQRHIKGFSGIAASYGSTEQGRFTELSYTRLLTDRIALRGALSRENGSLGSRGDYSAYGGRALFAPQLFRVGEVLYVHLLVGPTGQYERRGQDNSDTALPADATRPQRFTYGPLAGTEVDLFLLNRVSLVGTATKGYLFNNPLIDKWPGFYSGGIRYHFR